MMKKIIYIAIITSLFLGCTNDYLTVNPHDRLSDGSFWIESKDIDLGLAGCYNSLYGIPLFNSRNPDWDGLTDNAYDRQGSYLAIARGPINLQTGNAVSSMYSSSYGAIARFNQFLSKIDDVGPETDTSKVAKAEVYFLRAFVYFYLTELYGGVPLIVEPYKLNDGLKDKSLKEDVVAQIHKDVDLAIASLPHQVYNGNVVKVAAQLLKVKVYMANNDFPNALTLAKKIKSDNAEIHVLHDDFGSMFVEAGQDANKEILFSTKYLYPNVVHANPVAYGWWNPMCPYQSFVDIFECTDGLSIADSPLYDANTPYANRDPRLFATIVTPNSVWDAFNPDWPIFDKVKYPVLVGATSTGFIVRKVCNMVKNQRAVAQYDKGASDMVLMRWAEVLLSIAEAENEVNGPTADAYTNINEVRARTSVGMPPITPGLSKEQFREKVRKERRIEFAFEIGMRYFDLKRWETAKEVLHNFETGVGDVKYAFEDKNYLWPFPLTEIDFYKAQGKELEQNPGY